MRRPQGGYEPAQNRQPDGRAKADFEESLEKGNDLTTWEVRLPAVRPETAHLGCGRPADATPLEQGPAHGEGPTPSADSAHVAGPRTRRTLRPFPSPGLHGT